MSSSILVDNSNGRINHLGRWTTGSELASDGVGSTATLEFTGNIVSVLATIPAGSGDVRVDFSIDGRAPTTQTRRAGGSRATGVEIFNSGYLETWSPHTLVVTFRGGPGLVLEGIRYEGADAPVQAPQNLPPPASTPPPNTPSPVVTTPEPTPSTPSSSEPSTSDDSDDSTSAPDSTTDPSSAPTPTPPPIVTNAPGFPGDESAKLDTSSAAKSPTPIGAIIGGVIGGIALILVIAVIVILLRKKRKRAIELQEVALRDEPTNAFGYASDYATSATGLVDYNPAPAVAPPVYTESPGQAESREYISQPVTKASLNRLSANRSQASVPYANNHNYNNAGLGVGQGAPVAQHYYGDADTMAGPSGVAHSVVHSDTNDTGTVSAYSAYSGIARSEQLSSNHAYSMGHQQQPSMTISEASTGRTGPNTLPPVPAPSGVPPPTY